MNGDSIACQNLSLEYKALASRPLSSKDPTINERQYRIAKEIMDIANYLSKSASLIESCEHKQSAWKPGKVNLIKYTNLNLVSQLTKQSRYSYGSVRYTKSFKEWNKLEKTQRVVVQFADGTREDSRFCDDVNEEWGDEKTSSYRRIGFRKVIEPKDIVSVTFGDQTVVLNPNVKMEQRTKLRSKAANCTVALPQNVAKLITVKEKKNVKNADFKKKESYAMFMAKKNGVKMPFFTIHKIKGEYSPEQVEKKNDTMTYIDSRDGDTYTIEYGEIMDEKQAKEFKDILNTYISNVLPYFEIIR